VVINGHRKIRNQGFVRSVIHHTGTDHGKTKEGSEMMKKCSNCNKIIWPWQKRVEKSWMSNRVGGLIAYYHNYECATLTPLQQAVKDKYGGD